MNGRVDESSRALMDIAIRRTESDGPTIVTVWIDTAFNGFLVFPQQMIQDLGLQQEAATEAILVDGSRVTLESFACYVEWFGQLTRAQVDRQQRKAAFTRNRVAGEEETADRLRFRNSVD